MLPVPGLHVPAYLAEVTRRVRDPGSIACGAIDPERQLREGNAAQRAAYTAALDTLMARAQALDDRTLRGLFRILDEARRDLNNMLLDTDWKRAHYGVLKTRLDALRQSLAKRLRLDLRGAQADGFTLGAEEVDELLSRFGGEREMLSIPLDLHRIAVLQEFSADLVQSVTQEVIDDVSSTLRQGLLEHKGAREIIREMSGRLVNPDGSPAPNIWGDTLTRATVIYRTEMGRSAALAEQARMAEANQEFPGLQRYWLHAGIARKPRRSHVRAGRDYRPGGSIGPIDVTEPFVIVVESEEATRATPEGEYECMYPRDPRLPPALSISCRCGTVPWRPEWFGLKGIAA